jgi:hypothetical protein
MIFSCAYLTLFAMKIGGGATITGQATIKFIETLKSEVLI